MADTPNWVEKVHYKIDEIFSKGTGVMIFWLIALTLGVIFLVALIVVGLGISPPGEDLNFFEVFWMSLLRTLDAGTMADDQGWLFRIMMLFVTLGGVFIISVLIGIITTGLEARLRALQRGRSKVIESNHTVILGWSEKIFTVINEICIANENQKDGCIVILGDQDRVTMEEQIAEVVTETRGTRIVCRSGSPIDPASLEILRLHATKSIVILAPKGEAPDAEVIKICMAITRHAKRDDRPFHIVAELRQERNLDIARIVGGDEVEWVLSDDIISRMIVQTCHQSGLSIIYTDLMDYAGDEIYFYSHPSLVGKPFGELLNCFQKNLVMGIWKKGERPVLNPPMDMVFEIDDQIFLLAEDDDQIFFADFDASLIQEGQIQHMDSEVYQPEKILILGWNSKAERILLEMDHYIPINSEILVVANPIFVQNVEAWNNVELKNAKLKFQHGNTNDRALLEKLTPQNFEHIIILSYNENLSYQVADSRTMISLLHLRDIANKCKDCQFSIVTEMLDLRNRELAEITHVDDFVVSDYFISLYLSQVSETKLLNAVFQNLLESEGSEVYLRPAQDYVVLGEEVNFYTMVESARRKDEVALGYRIGTQANDPDQTFGIVLNPNKSNLYRYQQGDQLIVLSETF
jgi:ion channel POLLUX/CASTOR